MEANKGDFYQIDNDLTAKSIQSLNTAMLTMTHVREAISSMVKVSSSAPSVMN